MKTTKTFFAVSQMFCMLLLIGVAATPQAQAEDQTAKPKKVYTDGDPYKFRVDADWWYDHPSVSIKGSGNVQDQTIDFDKVFGFSSLSTFDVLADWHFTHRQHFTFQATQYQETKSRTLQQQITFKGVTYDAGAAVSANVKNTTYAPGYKFDIIRNERGSLGLIAQINLMDISAKLNGEGTIEDTNTGESASGVYARSGSVFAPLPVAGPEAKYLFIKNSNKYYVDGFVKGMYFFGYGNFVSTRGIAGWNVWKGLDVTGGYQMGSRLAIHGTASRLDVRFTQRGFVGGLAYKW